MNRFLILSAGIAIWVPLVVVLATWNPRHLAAVQPTPTVVAATPTPAPIRLHCVYVLDEASNAAMDCEQRPA